MQCFKYIDNKCTAMLVACSRLECIDNTSYVFSKWDGSVAVAFKERKIILIILIYIFVSSSFTGFNFLNHTHKPKVRELK